MALFAEFRVRCVLDCGCPLSFAEGGAFFWASRAGRSPARAPRSGAGGGAGGGTPPPQRFLRSCWAGEGLWAYQEGQMGQKLVCFGGLRGTRSRQDESKEVHEAGRIRPSSGSNGGHVLSLYPLIWRSLLGVLFASLACCASLRRLFSPWVQLPPPHVDQRNLRLSILKIGFAWR